MPWEMWYISTVERKVNKMSIGYALLIGLFTGTLGTTGVFLWIKGKEDPTQLVLKNQGEVIKDLAEIQLTSSPGKYFTPAATSRKNSRQTDINE